jgi:hypothetical protein
LLWAWHRVGFKDDAAAVVWPDDRPVAVTGATGQPARLHDDFQAGLLKERLELLEADAPATFGQDDVLVDDAHWFTSTALA